MPEDTIKKPATEQSEDEEIKEPPVDCSTSEVVVPEQGSEHHSETELPANLPEIADAEECLEECECGEADDNYTLSEFIDDFQKELQRLGETCFKDEESVPESCKPATCQDYKTLCDLFERFKYVEHSLAAILYADPAFKASVEEDEEEEEEKEEVKEEEKEEEREEKAIEEPAETEVKPEENDEKPEAEKEEENPEEKKEGEKEEKDESEEKAKKLKGEKKKFKDRRTYRQRIEGIKAAKNVGALFITIKQDIYKLLSELAAKCDDDEKILNSKGDEFRSIYSIALYLYNFSDDFAQFVNEYVGSLVRAEKESGGRYNITVIIMMSIALLGGIAMAVAAKIMKTHNHVNPSN